MAQLDQVGDELDYFCSGLSNRLQPGNAWSLVKYLVVKPTNYKLEK